MKKNFKTGFAALFSTLLISLSFFANAQSEKSVIKKYLTKLPSVAVNTSLQKYRMTAVYINRDLYGNFTGKTKVVGDYTHGLANGEVAWNNVYISASNNFSEPFPEGTKQEYMENMKYIPSPKMLETESFKNFPATPESVLARNLVWDMMAIEDFAWKYTDSLELNVDYTIKGGSDNFNMADIGKYAHNSLQFCWTGISQMNNVLCAILEYRATDNLIELNMDQIKTKGTEQYWGTVWISLKTRMIEYASMFAGSMQEIQVKGLDNKFLIKTIRDLYVRKIQ
jgi:hypothetical protein